MGRLSRRSLLTVCGSAVGALGGCSSASLQRSPTRFAVDIENVSSETTKFTLRVFGTEKQELLTDEGTLAAGTQLSYVFTGTPASIHIRFDDTALETFPWPTPSCAGGEPAPKVELTYGLETSPRETRVFGRCEAIPTTQETRPTSAFSQRLS